MLWGGSAPPMTVAPEVSVVMSVFNGEQYLHESINCILNQQGVDFELVIIDDGSIDSTPRILADYARQDARIRLLTQQNMGLTAALIRGCAAARGEFIARQDVDDLSLSNR